MVIVIKSQLKYPPNPLLLIVSILYEYDASFMFFDSGCMK